MLEKHVVVIDNQLRDKGRSKTMCICGPLRLTVWNVDVR